jgi:hypothetical protein
MASPAARRALLLTGAALFFAYEQWAFAQWMRAHGTVGAGLAHAWSTLRQDPMVFMAWNDMGVFTALVLAWLWQDLRARGGHWLWWPATLLMGCPPLLVYLARRAPSSPVAPSSDAPRPS